MPFSYGPQLSTRFHTYNSRCIHTAWAGSAGQPKYMIHQLPFHGHLHPFMYFLYLINDRLLDIYPMTSVYIHVYRYIFFLREFWYLLALSRSSLEQQPNIPPTHTHLDACMSRRKRKSFSVLWIFTSRVPVKQFNHWAVSSQGMRIYNLQFTCSFCLLTESSACLHPPFVQFVILSWPVLSKLQFHLQINMLPLWKINDFIEICFSAVYFCGRPPHPTTLTWAFYRNLYFYLNAPTPTPVLSCSSLFMETWSSLLIGKEPFSPLL